MKIGHRVRHKIDIIRWKLGWKCKQHNNLWQAAKSSQIEFFFKFILNSAHEIRRKRHDL